MKVEVRYAVNLCITLNKYLARCSNALYAFLYVHCACNRTGLHVQRLINIMTG